MDLDSLTPVDHARRYALLLTSALGTFVFIALWMAAEWNFFVSVLLGVAAGTLAFYPLRALSQLFFPPPRRTVRRTRR